MTRCLFKKLVLTFGTSIIFTVNIFAQETLNTAGADVAGPGGSASYSIGQTHYGSAEGSSGYSTEGVQQPIEIYKLGVPAASDLSITVYPNPASSHLQLKMGQQTSPGMKYALFDMAGKLLVSEKISRRETLLSLEPFAAGTFVLLIQDGAATLQSFKIIKNF